MLTRTQMKMLGSACVYTIQLYVINNVQEEYLRDTCLVKENMSVRYWHKKKRKPVKNQYFSLILLDLKTYTCTQPRNIGSLVQISAAFINIYHYASIYGNITIC